MIGAMFYRVKDTEVVGRMFYHELHYWYQIHKAIEKGYKNQVDNIGK